MSRRLACLALAFVLLVGAAVLAVLLVRPPPLAGERTAAPPTVLPEPAPLPGAEAVPAPPPEARREPPLHPLAVSFGTPSIPPEREPEILLQILDAYRRLQGTYPTGEDNAAVMALLTGTRRGGVRMFPADHTRINAAGALTDAWGTPFFFHHLSSQAVDVRSAGPDREFHTADDVVTPQRPPLAVDPSALPARQAGPAAGP